MNRSGTKCLQTCGKVSIVPPPTALFFLPCAGKKSVALSVYPVSWSKTKACYGLYIVQKPSQPFHKSFTFFHMQMVYIFLSLLYLHWIKFFILQWLQLKNNHPSFSLPVSLYFVWTLKHILSLEWSLETASGAVVKALPPHSCCGSSLCPKAPLWTHCWEQTNTGVPNCWRLQQPDLSPYGPPEWQTEGHPQARACYPIPPPSPQWSLDWIQFKSWTELGFICLCQDLLQWHSRKGKYWTHFNRHHNNFSFSSLWLSVTSFFSPVCSAMSWSNTAPYSSWIFCISLMWLATLFIVLMATGRETERQGVTTGNFNPPRGREGGGPQSRGEPEKSGVNSLPSRW